MPGLDPLTPGSSIAITVAATTATVGLPAKTGNQVMVSSLSGNAVAFIAFGISTVTAVIPTGTAANGIPILPGTVQVFTVPPTFGFVASIGTVSNTLYITGGDGI